MKAFQIFIKAMKKYTKNTVVFVAVKVLFIKVFYDKFAPKINCRIFPVRSVAPYTQI